MQNKVDISLWEVGNAYLVPDAKRGGFTLKVEDKDGKRIAEVSLNPPTDENVKIIMGDD